MANPVLFASSVFVTILHALGQFWYRPTNALLAATITCGLATSIWNHGVTSPVAKAVDRVAMWVGFTVDAYLISSIPDHPRWSQCAASLVAAALLYWVAKLLLRWHADTSTTTNMSSLQPSLETTPPRRTRRLQRGDLPHLTAHLTLTATHLLLMSAFAQSF